MKFKDLNQYIKGKRFVANKNHRIKNHDMNEKWCNCGKFILIPKGFIMRQADLSLDTYWGFLQEGNNKIIETHVTGGTYKGMLKDKRFTLIDGGKT